MIAFNWNFLPACADTAQALHHSLRIPIPLCQVLAQRGMGSETAARRFFRFILSDTHDPMLMRDMDRALERLNQALQKNEKILLYGDYDVDGTTSISLLFHFLESFKARLDYYIPDRDKEGYGVSKAGIEYARGINAALIIAMDCGIRANEQVELAKSWGIDFIICDHHLPAEPLPPAVAILDPKRADCAYPYKELSGCGITFKLVQAFAARHNIGLENLLPYLDLVAISTACDIVPMTGENRLLTRFGLQQINRSPRLGIWALLQNSNRNIPLDVEDLVFGLGPMINAPGRLGDAREAVKLLLSKDKDLASAYAARLMRQNRERRELNEATAREAQQQLQGEAFQGNTIVLYDASWHKGIIGIVASKMVEMHHKPSVILTKSHGRLVGSARAVPGFDLYEALQACAADLITFGGHAHAAGLQLLPEKLEQFKAHFEQQAAYQSAKIATAPPLDIAAEVRFEEITPDFMKILRHMEPFGPENRNPVFCARNVIDSGKSRLLEQNHARLDLVHLERGAIAMQGIAFGLGEMFRELQDQVMDVAFTLKESQWKGKSRIELYLKALRPAQ